MSLFQKLYFNQNRLIHIFLFLLVILPSTILCQLSLTIGDGSQNARIPVDFYYKNSLFETIYQASEMTAGGLMTSITFYNNFTSTELAAGMPIKIWLGVTGLSDLSAGWIPSTSLTLVFDGYVSFPNGLNDIQIPLQTPYLYTGGNLVMLVQRPMDSIYYDSTDFFKCQTVGSNRSLKIHSDTVGYNPAAPPPGATLSGQFPKTTFYFSLQGMGAVQGTVTCNGIPLPGASVSIAGTQWTKTTDTNGYYDFPFLASGSYDIICNRTFFQSQTQQVNITEADTTVLDFDLVSLIEHMIFSPNGGENWRAGSIKTVYWNPFSPYSTINQVNVFLSINYGSSWIQLNSSPVDVTQGYFAFTVPYVSSNQCLIKVVSSTDGNINDVSDGIFTISNNPPSSLSLTAPSNAKLQSGKNYNISWIAIGTQNVKLEYSTDAGLTWNSITSSIASSIATYSWQVPDSPSDYVYVRISDTTNPLIYDWSDIPYIICSLQLESPNGVYTILANSMTPITWTSSQVTNVKLEYSNNNGVSWTQIISSTPALAGSYNWSVPTIASDQYIVRISDVDDNNINDTSENVFSVALLNLIYPNDENVRIQTGRDIYISWNSQFMSGSISIELSIDNGVTYSILATLVDVGLGTFLWTVPDTPSTACKIRITSEQFPEIKVSSSFVFTICRLTLISPNGYVIWGGWAPHEISWSSVNIQYLTIEYSQNNGDSWSYVESGVTASNGSYTWTPPAINSDMCRIRISDAYCTIIYDYSDTTFTIRPQIVLNTPNGGENLTIYSICSILWTTTAEVSFVLIDYSIDGGNAWLPIQTSPYPASVGRYDWIVPNNPSTNCKVRVRKSTDGSVFDESNDVFTITPTIFPPIVDFVADKTEGLEPLVVQFTDLSSSGSRNIVSWLWDFGDNSTSIEQNPMHTYESDGVYSVALTVTNSFDSTRTLIKQGYINVLPRYPLIQLYTPIHLSYGITYIGDTSAPQSIQVKNTGTATLNIFPCTFYLNPSQFEVVESSFPIILNPGDSTEMQVVFRPSVNGSVTDSLIINSDAFNDSSLSVKLTAIGQYVPPAPVENVTMDIVGNDVMINWSPVTETIYGSPIIPDGYIVLYNENAYSEDSFWFLTFTPNLNYTHQYVALFRSQMFYKLLAVKFYSRDEELIFRTMINRKDRINWQEFKKKFKHIN